MLLCKAPPPCRGRRPHHAGKDRVGTWEVSRLAERYRSLRSAAGRRGAEAADERTREVTSRCSSYEPGEQGGEVRGGAGGAKGGNQGECGPAKHTPDAGPGACDPGAGPHTASRQRPTCASPSTTRGRNRMRESRTYGSARGASSNGRPYRDRRVTNFPAEWRSRCGEAIEGIGAAPADFALGQE